MSRWSKRYDVKVVPRRYLHLYRCFGWTPTTPTAIPQYDWERRGPNNAAAYTSADISANLQEYDDLGLQRKELVAIQRNTKFYQYKKTYPRFFKDEKQFNKLMAKYTVSKGNKTRGIRQSFNIVRRVLDAIFALVYIALLVGVILFRDQFVDYISNPNSTVLGFHIIPVLLGAMALCMLVLTFRKLSFGKNHFYYSDMGGKEEDFLVRKKHKKIVVSFRQWELLIFVAMFAFYALLSAEIIKLENPFTLEQSKDTLLRCIAPFTILAIIVHVSAIFTYNPYAWIKALCLQARPVTKRILMSDVSMMSQQQRQRYNQGRIISAAVNDALEKRSQGIKEDFYIGY